jgi:hypothetical protein
MVPHVDKTLHRIIKKTKVRRTGSALKHRKTKATPYFPSNPWEN